MAVRLDEHDRKIVTHLGMNGRMSVAELSRKIKLSRPTTTSRLNRLVDEALVIIRAGVNLQTLGYKLANVDLEVKGDATRREVEMHLKHCPRILDMFRTSGKANIHLRMWGDDDHTVNSMIESLRDLPNVEVVHTQYLGTPISGDIIIHFSRDDEETPCGRICATCPRYTRRWCAGCPVSTDYRTSLMPSPSGENDE